MQTIEEQLQQLRQKQYEYQELLDKQALYELSCRYCRGIDRYDRDLIVSAYHSDAIDDRGFFKGNPSEFGDFVVKVLDGVESGFHMLGNALYEVEGDLAFGEVYFFAQHRIIEDGNQLDWFVAGRYVDRYERRDGIWKIAYRKEIMDWNRKVSAADAWVKDLISTPPARGARGMEDLAMDKERLRRL